MSVEKNIHEVHFNKLFEYAKKLRSRYMNTLAALVLFDRMNELNVTSKVGKKKAEENVKIINFHRYFFFTTKEATRCYLLIELAKFFDQSTQSLTLFKTLEYAENNLSSFSTANFKKNHKDRQIFPELFENYKPLGKEDLNKLRDRLSRNRDKIERLKTYRDKFLAHDDLKKTPVEITKKDIPVLMKIVKDTVDLLYFKLEFSSNSYKNFKDDPRREIDQFMSSLRKQERQRLAEIEREFGVKVVL